MTPDYSACGCYDEDKIGHTLNIIKYDWLIF